MVTHIWPPALGRVQNYRITNKVSFVQSTNSTQMALDTSIPSKILTTNHSFVLFLHCNDCCNSLLFISVCIPIQICISAFCHQRYQYCWQGSLKIFLNSPGWLNMAKYYHFQCICKGNTSVLLSFTNKASIKDILQALIIMCYSSAPQSSERTWMYMTNS